MTTPLRTLWFRSAAALAVAACIARGGTLHAAEPAGTLPIDQLRLAMPITNAQPANALPVTAVSAKSFAEQLDAQPTPPQNLPIDTGRHFDSEYASPKQSFDPFEMPGGESFGSGPVFEQYPDNWMWGAGGSPYRTGPGDCDDWKVGPVWDVSVDGMTLFRDEADLDDLEAEVRTDDELGIAVLEDPYLTQFGYSGGARIWAMGKLPRSEKYQVQFGYEGIEEWNAAVLFPEQELDADPDIMQAKSLHYRSSMHSAEMNFYRRIDPTIRPFWGFRYLRFTDEITDTTDQSAPFPLPIVADPGVMDTPTIVTFEDNIDYIDIKNNLIGFQLGLREDLWHLNRRVTIQGFVNAGVYYNHIQFADGSLNNTTTFTSAVLDDPASDPDESAAATTSTSSSGVVSSSEPSDVAYLAEASITAVCRLNKCVALRGGYQVFWVNGLALAEDAYLGDPLGSHDFLMQGWHAGVEYRR